MNNKNRIELFVEELNSGIIPNYRIVCDIFDSEYGYPTLDPIRDEICKCIICGLYQATITLTNHLLEKSLKFCLGVRYSSENKKENAKIENAFVEGVDKYDNLLLDDTINRACTQGLITKEQKKELKQLKDTFRNPYSHANSDIYKDISVKGKTVTIKDLENGIDKFMEKCFDSDSDSEIPLRKIPFAQGIFQVKIASENSVPYFKKVDEIIRIMLSNLKQKGDNE
jgi:hypothetical protein